MLCTSQLTVISYVYFSDQKIKFDLKDLKYEMSIKLAINLTTDIHSFKNILLYMHPNDYVFNKIKK